MSDGDSGLCITVRRSQSCGCEGDDSSDAERGQCITVASLWDSWNDNSASIDHDESGFCITARGKETASKDGEGNVPKGRKRSSLTVDDLLNPSNENDVGEYRSRLRSKKRSRSDMTPSPKKRKRRSLTVQDLLNPSDQDDGNQSNIASG